MAPEKNLVTGYSQQGDCKKSHNSRTATFLKASPTLTEVISLN